MLQKQCLMCGKTIEVPDNRRKYCNECRVIRKRFMDNNALAKLRERSKERRKKEQQLLREQQSRIKFLEGIIVKQQQQIQRLESIVNQYSKLGSV